MGPQLAGGLLHHAEVAIVEEAAEAGLPLGVARVLDVQRAVAERLRAVAVGRGRGHRHRVAPFVLEVRRAAGSALPLTRSEEHTSELQSLMRSSYAVFCLKKKK